MSDGTADKRGMKMGFACRGMVCARVRDMPQRENAEGGAPYRYFHTRNRRDAGITSDQSGVH